MTERPKLYMHTSDGTEKHKMGLRQNVRKLLEIKQVQHDLERPKGRKQLNVS